MWLPNVMVLLLIGVRTGALQQRDVVSRRCYVCSGNATACQPPAGALLAIVECPAARTQCATVASAPDFVSSLTCAASSQTSCSLSYSTKDNMELSCVCTDNLCNAPFTAELTNLLHIFASSNMPRSNDTAELTTKFLKTTNFASVSQENLYKVVTLRNNNTSTTKRSIESIVTTKVPIVTILDRNVAPQESGKPRAEALKQEASLSDDDEDESEGSGADEDARSAPRPASAPAAPSSFLPAENKAPISLTNILFTMPLFLGIVI